MPLPPCLPNSEASDGYTEPGVVRVFPNPIDDYSQVEEQRDIIEEVIYDEGLRGNDNLDYEEPRDILNPPPSIQKLSVVDEDDFPAYDFTFKSKKVDQKLSKTSTEYSQIILPKIALKPNRQVVNIFIISTLVNIYCPF